MLSKLITVGIGAGAAVLALASATGSEARTTSVDLSTSGSVVAGVTGGQAMQRLAFSFVTTNHSTTTAVSLAVTYTITHGTADARDYICPLVASHFDINPDTPSCEPGTLAHGRSANTAIIVTPNGSGPVSVKACGTDLGGTTDPSSGNNCKTLTVPIS
jgi:hypothetical protein